MKVTTTFGEEDVEELKSVSLEEAGIGLGVEQILEVIINDGRKSIQALNSLFGCHLPDMLLVSLMGLASLNHARTASPLLDSLRGGALAGALLFGDFSRAWSLSAAA